MATKVAFIFEGDGYGWTEYLRFERDFDAGLETDVRQIAEARCQLLAYGYSMKAIRYTKIGQKRATAITTECQSFPVNSAAADVPWNAILVQLNALSIFHRAYYIRGVPDTYINYSFTTGNESWSGSLTDRLTTFCDLLVTTQVSWEVTKRIGDTAKYAPVNRFFDNGFAKTSVTFRQAITGLTDGDQIHIFNAKGKLHPAQKTWTVSNIVGGGTGCDIDLTFAGITGYDPKDIRKTLAAKVEKSTATVFDYSLERFVKKQPGKAFFKRRGRRRARK